MAALNCNHRHYAQIASALSGRFSMLFNGSQSRFQSLSSCIIHTLYNMHCILIWPVCLVGTSDSRWSVLDVPRTYRSFQLVQQAISRLAELCKLFETQMTERLFNQPEQLKDTIMYFSLMYLLCISFCTSPASPVHSVPALRGLRGFSWQCRSFECVPVWHFENSPKRSEHTDRVY